MSDDGRPGSSRADGGAHPSTRHLGEAPLPLRQFTYELTIPLPAPPPRVWTAFTLDIDRWWNYRLRDRARCVLEPEVGGRWIQAWDSGGALFGTFTVWDPPHLLVVTGALAMTRPASNVLQIRFGAVAGGTEVTVRHDAFGVFDADAGPMYEAGWRELIDDSLRAHLARG